MAGTLKDKVALVTGGSRGIGAAIAKRLAKEGAHVAISYTSSPDKANAVVKEMEKMGVKAAAFQANQAKPSEVEEMVKKVAKQFGRIDILVNNAGVFVGGHIGDPSYDAEKMAHQMAVNVTGVVKAVHTAVPFMKEGSKIILIGSVNGERVPGAGYADYSSTKSALLGYTKGWARDLGSKNITVNMVQPGPVDTDMNPADSDFAKQIIPQVPMGRYGTSEEIAGAVAFLVGPDASYITGTTLTVDGGFNA